jgi:hypothetical protein
VPAEIPSQRGTLSGVLPVHGGARTSDSYSESTAKGDKMDLDQEPSGKSLLV